MRVIHDQCCLTYATYLWIMLFARRAHVFTNATCCFPTLMSSNRCAHATCNASKLCLILPIVVRHHFSDTHKLWTMLPTVGRHRCCFKMHTCLVQCVQAFGDATFHLPKSFSRFPHVILDGWTPWLMMSTVRGRHLPEAQMSWMMVSVVGLSQYYPLDAHMTHVMHSCLDDVVWHCPI